MRRQSFALAVLAIIGSTTPSSAESSPCTNGIVIPEPQNHPALVEDCEALLAVRDQLFLRVHWEDGTWTGDISITDWHGVFIDNSRVARLHFFHSSEGTVFSMQGTLPSELGKLTALTELVLTEHNLVEGPIPHELVNLTHLVRLDLSGNSLVGPIPAELFNLRELKWLFLNNNNLRGPIPPELFTNLSSLEALGLGNRYGGNDWMGPIPPEIGRAKNLRVLQLSTAGLTGLIPPEIGALSNLRHLDLRRNQLTGPIPPEFGQLERLETLWLGENELTESIPAELGRLPELRHLALNDNQLSGSIPTEMGKLGGLEILDLENNALTGQIPSELGKLSKLRLLLLSGNSIVGPLPRELGQLGNLSRIRVDPDVVVGCIPAGLVRFFDGPICPEYANPCENGLAVKNPEEHPDLVRDCKTLLALRDALGGDYRLDWTGDKPIESWQGIIVNDSQVTGMRLVRTSRNRMGILTGEIPPELGELTALRELNLRGARLTGSIPRPF